MTSSKNDSCTFGAFVIKGKAYADDLMIHPDGKILKSSPRTKWRKP